MPDLVCNTSVLQYLHGLGRLDLLPQLSRMVFVPSAVVAELGVGRRQGIDVPDVSELLWAQVRTPQIAIDAALSPQLGAGEVGVLALGMELGKNAVALALDDRLARRTAKVMGMRVTGTLGLLVDGKNAGLIDEVRPHVDRLEALGFRLSARARQLVLARAGEAFQQ